MLDETMSYAATLSRRFETMMVTLQTSVSYLRPTPIARVIARGEVLRFGTAGVAMQGTLRNSDGQVLAVATATAVPRPLRTAAHTRPWAGHPAFPPGADTGSGGGLAAPSRPAVG